MKKILYILLIAPLFFISSCEEETQSGCTFEWADNYNSDATDDDGTCYLAGCMYPLACNYNSLSTINNGTCEYPEDGYDCQGNTMPLEFGAPLHGGLVFYIDETGEHGLVAAFEDPLYNNSGFGYTWNEALTFASAYTTDGYSDWYLPSIEELELMYMTIGPGGSEGNIGGFATNFAYINDDECCGYNDGPSPLYWTSSSPWSGGADGTDFSYHVLITDTWATYKRHSIRVIRSF